MANIIGIRSGLVPSVDAPRPAQRGGARRSRGATAAPTADMVTELKATGPRVCNACDGDMGSGGFKETKVRGRKAYVSVAEDDIPYCAHCRDFFGIGRLHPGRTNVPPAVARDEMRETQEAGYVMLLRSRRFGCQGFNVCVEAGDVFKVARAGSPAYSGNRPLPSAERTKSMFSISLSILGEGLILFPHEFSPISFVRVMELRATGELNEVYLSNEDQEGHFAPSPKVRKLIMATFGNLVS
uniref:Uncharacterized protein n=1 Tax=Burkholderia sp. M701 TaxID=326454 RepID=V5YNP3_9BURK|nr:hypothetical protein [Burkholderia sp. M701]BAO19007.1 hypothetical protein [Burkholderia sp. M701]